METVIRSQWTCPVDGCDWHYDPAEDMRPTRYIVRTDIPLQEAMLQAVDEAARERAERVKAALREHLSSHDVFDFVYTIRRLETELYQPYSGIRPHSHFVDNLPRDADGLIEFPKTWSGSFGHVFPKDWTP